MPLFKPSSAVVAVALVPRVHRRQRPRCLPWIALGSCLLLSACTASPSADQPAKENGPLPSTPAPPPPINPNGGVTFSVPSGTFEGTLEVELRAAAGAEIRFTTDGSRPSFAAELYEAPLSLDETAQVRAQAYLEGVPSGESSTAIYVRRDIDADSNLPLLVLDAYGRGKPEDRSRFHDVALMLFEPLNGVARLTDLPSVASRAGWRVRGQSSANFAKTPYRIELWNEQDEDLDRALAGLPAESDWALIGPFVDRSLIRNAVVYDLGREMGLQAPRYAWVEAYITLDPEPLSANSYQGVYMLTETIKNARNRLDLSQLRLPDTAAPKISGGYILRFDWSALDESDTTLPCTGDDPISVPIFGGPERARGTCWFDLEVVDPDPINDAQHEWVTGYVQELHDRLHQDPPSDYEALIDVDSFVDHFLINELTRDMDAYARSTLFHKDRDGKLVAGPLWDYNLTFAAGGFFDNTSTSGWQFEQRIGSNDWYHRLATDPRFRQRAAARWQQWRRGLLSDRALEQRIADMVIPLAEAAARDFQRWPVSSTANELFRIPPGTSWQAQLQAIRDWLSLRLAWLDAAFERLASE